MWNLKPIFQRDWWKWYEKKIIIPKNNSRMKRKKKENKYNFRGKFTVKGQSPSSEPITKPKIKTRLAGKWPKSWGGKLTNTLFKTNSSLVVVNMWTKMFITNCAQFSAARFYVSTAELDLQLDHIWFYIWKLYTTNLKSD